jgi:Ser/Thr protein kinase RdoA (MazF antagonist)
VRPAAPTDGRASRGPRGLIGNGGPRARKGTPGARPLRGLRKRHVPGLLAAFGLGAEARLSNEPVARGRLGAIWRLDTGGGSWAVKVVEELAGDELAGILEGAAFQEAAATAGVPTPAIRRTTDGEVMAALDGQIHVSVQSWVDLAAPALDLDPAPLGSLVARLHQVPFDGTVPLDEWYRTPVGEPGWRDWLARLRGADAPFAGELEALMPELVGLEGWVSRPSGTLRTCHRDLWADNVRGTSSGGLCVFDFDNAGLADPSQELACVLVEYAGDNPPRARAIRDAYAQAGGPGRVATPTDFSMAIAQLTHILEEGCRRWLDAGTDADRADNEAWVREYLDRPLTREGIEALLEAERTS